MKNLLQLIKLAQLMDQKGKFAKSDKIYKIVKADIDDADKMNDSDPLGIGNIEPTPQPKKLEDFLNPATQFEDFDPIKEHLKQKGFVVNVKDTDMLSEIYEFSNDIAGHLRSDMALSLVSELEKLALDGKLPMQYLDVDLDDAELTVNYFIEAPEKYPNAMHEDLKKRGYTSRSIAQLISNQEDMPGLLEDWLKANIDDIAEAASGFLGVEISPYELMQRANEVNLNINNISGSLDKIFAEIYFENKAN